jgi:hypothetical protein
MRGDHTGSPLSGIGAGMLGLEATDGVGDLYGFWWGSATVY